MSEKELDLINESSSESGQEKVVDGADYIKAIKEIKEKSVSREAYDKLKEEKRQLLESLVNGTAERDTEAEPEKVDINNLRKELFGGNDNMTNLEYVTKALQLRKELINQGKQDPFLPAGNKVIPTEEDINTANRVAKVLQDCVDYADGDSAVFTTELQRLTIDTGPYLKNKIRR